MISFSYTAASQQVVFGAGSLERLLELVESFGFYRLMLCTIPRFARSGLVERVAANLGERLVGIYAEAQPHVPETQVDAAARVGLDMAIDAVIGLGGGSPIGLAKAVSMELERARTGKEVTAASPAEQPLVPVIAIPTTYSGSEMTPIYGVTHQEADGARKVTVSDPKVTPRLAIYDPELTLELPSQMTASSGINALAHCIEAAYSISRSPLSSAAALSGVQYITRSLERCVAAGSDLEARTEMLTGAYLGAVCVAMAKIGLHHGLCHVLGGTGGVPHGVANAIILPHALRFNADATATELASVARSMDLVGDTELQLAKRAADAVFDLIGRIGLPQRLRDVGVAESDLPRLAEIALSSKAVQNNPKKISNASQTESVFRAAW